MKDLKIYYSVEDGEDKIDEKFEKMIGALAKAFNLSFQGSGFNFEANFRDLNYRKEKIKK